MRSKPIASRTNVRSTYRRATHGYQQRQPIPLLTALTYCSDNESLGSISSSTVGSPSFFLSSKYVSSSKQRSCVTLIMPPCNVQHNTTQTTKSERCATLWKQYDRPLKRDGPCRCDQDRETLPRSELYIVATQQTALQNNHVLESSQAQTKATVTPLITLRSVRNTNSDLHIASPLDLQRILFAAVYKIFAMLGLHPPFRSSSTHGLIQRLSRL